MISLDDVKIPYIFRPGKSPVPCEYRPWWRLVLIILMLRLNGRGMKLSFKQLQVLDWSLRSESNLFSLFSFLESGRFPLSAVISIDPALNRAVEFGVGEKFITLIGVSGGCRIEIGTKAAALLDSVLDDKEAFSVEIKALTSIGKKLTGPMAERLLA
jgi:hypothetical protein